MVVLLADARHGHRRSDHRDHAPGDRRSSRCRLGAPRDRQVPPPKGERTGRVTRLRSAKPRPYAPIALWPTGVDPRRSVVVTDARPAVSAPYSCLFWGAADGGT